MDARVVQERPRVVRVSGQIDLSNNGELLVVLDQAVEGATEGLVVDMSEVTYLDSSGIQTLLATYRRVSAQGGRLMLVVNHPNIREVMQIVHIDLLPGLMVYGDAASAQQALTGHPS